MAVTANVNLGNGVSASSAYLRIPVAYVKKYRPEKDGDDAYFKLVYDVEIYQNKTAADTIGAGLRQSKQIRCNGVDHFSIDYDPTTSTNPLALAYADLKSNSLLSSVSDA